MTGSLSSFFTGCANAAAGESTAQQTAVRPASDPRREGRKIGRSGPRAARVRGQPVVVRRPTSVSAAEYRVISTIRLTPLDGPRPERRTGNHITDRLVRLCRIIRAT